MMHFESELNLDFDGLCTLEVHNRTLFQMLQNALHDAEDEPEVCAPLLLVDNDAILKLSNSLYVGDPLLFDFSQRIVYSAMSKFVEREIAADPELLYAIESKYNEILSLLTPSTQALNFSTTLTPAISIPSILKTASFGIDPTEIGSVLTNALLIIDIACELRLWIMVVFTNLKSTLTNQEIELLAEHIASKKAPVLLLESIPSTTTLKLEQKVIIDDEYDEIRPSAATDFTNLDNIIL